MNLSLIADRIKNQYSDPSEIPELIDLSQEVNAPIPILMEVLEYMGWM